MGYDRGGRDGHLLGSGYNSHAAKITQNVASTNKPVLLLFFGLLILSGIYGRWITQGVLEGFIDVLEAEVSDTGDIMFLKIALIT